MPTIDRTLVRPTVRLSHERLSRKIVEARIVIKLRCTWFGIPFVLETRLLEFYSFNSNVMAYPSLVLINNAISFSTGNFDGLLNRARKITFVCSKIRFRVNWFIWYLFLDIVPFESSVEIYFSIITSIESCFFGRNFPRANLITFRVCCALGKYWWRTLSTKRKSWEMSWASRKTILEKRLNRWEYKG